MNVLQVKNLDIYIRKKKEEIPLVHNISFSIKRGETLAIVGESGSGKSVTASAILGLLSKPLFVAGGEIMFQEENLLLCSEKAKRGLRGREIGFVFQDYQGSFTPFIKIGKQLMETISSHLEVSKVEAKSLVKRWLQKVNLPVERVFNSYPFQISGGQLQRAALAGAMMLEPKLLIADEPTTALDVITGELVLDIMFDLQKETGSAILIISHDLRQVLKRADNIVVMRHGHIVEMQSSEIIASQAKHPYTRLLLKARPLLSEIHEKLTENKEIKKVVNLKSEQEVV